MSADVTRCPRCRKPLTPVIQGVMLCDHCQDVLTRKGILYGMALYEVARRLVAAREELRFLLPRLTGQEHIDAMHLSGLLDADVYIPSIDDPAPAPPPPTEVRRAKQSKGPQGKRAQST